MINLLFILTTVIQSSIVKVNVPANYIGWCYIVPSDIVNSSDGYDFNENGIAYVNSKAFKTLSEVNIYQSDTDITLSVKYMSKAHITNSNGHNTELIKFYIPSYENAECCLESWDDPDVNYKYSSQEKKHRKELIELGKLRLKD